ncbi:MAG: type I restriction enzyme R subunit, partial [Kiritimatiellia bacterium]
EVDLSHVVLSHYRLSKIKQQNLKIQEEEAGYELQPGDGLGSAKAKDKKEELLSQIIARLNEVFVSDGLTDNDLLNYAYAIRDKVSENNSVINQMTNNTVEQALLGDFPKALVNAVMDSGEAHNNQKMQLLSNPERLERFTRLVFDLLT